MKHLLGLLVRSILSYFNYKLVAANFTNWALTDKEFYDIFNEQKSFGWFEDNGPKIQRMHMIKNLLGMVKLIPGEWAEVGVFKGSTAFLMYKYGKKYNLINKNSKIHLFDSFQGCSQPLPEDKDTFIKKGDYLGTLEEVKSNLSDDGTFIFYPGWIPTRFFEVENLKFSFIHIDVDLYQPVKDTLDFFIPRMSKGGIIVFDDYGFDGTLGAFAATNEICKKYNLKIHGLEYGQAFIVVY